MTNSEDMNITERLISDTGINQNCWNKREYVYDIKCEADNIKYQDMESAETEIKTYAEVVSNNVVGKRKYIEGPSHHII